MTGQVRHSGERASETVGGWVAGFAYGRQDGAPFAGCWGYVRVSTDMQDAGAAAQVRALQAARPIGAAGH